MKILAIVAHPDDDVIFCGGTLAKHTSRGDEVHVTYLTRGELGGMGDQSRNDLATTRTREAHEAAKHLDVTVSFLDFEDGQVQYNMEQRRRIADLIRARDPELLMTHHRDDSHPDHRVTSRLVTDGFYLASLPLFETDHKPSDPENIYFFGKSTADFEPDIFVDISQQQKTKEKAIREHQSQIDFLNKHGGLDREFDHLVETIRARARVEGRRCGVEYAEGFTRLHDVAVEFLSEP